MSETIWHIDVASWGSILFEGTEEEAEEWRRHKARWEQSVARKRLATEDEIRNAKKIVKADAVLVVVLQKGSEK